VHTRVICTRNADSHKKPFWALDVSWRPARLKNTTVFGAEGQLIEASANDGTLH
jgi:hypothetical protein